MRLSKILGMLLSMCLMLSLLIACGSGEQAKEYEYEQAQKAYEELNNASELCMEAIDTIYGAWYFAIYEAELGVSDYKNYDGFEAKTGLTYNEIESAMKSIGLSYDDSFMLTEFSYAVKIAQICLTNKNIYKNIHTHIENAKAYLKEVTDEYSDYTAYPTLKRYYSEITSYLEFIESPSGSFSQLKTTIDNYETNIRTYKNDLSFTLE